MKKRIKMFAAWGGKHYWMLLYGILTISLILVVLQIAIRWPFVILSTLAIASVPLIYFTINSEILPVNKKKGVKAFRTSLSFAACASLNSILLIVMNSLLPEAMRSIIGIICIVADILVIAAVRFSNNTSVEQEKFEQIADINLIKKLGLEDKPKRVPGDIILCANKETGEPVVLPCKDRFLHMLILGPTGSGKTSQVILPMLNQDMKNLEAGITVIEPKGDLAEKAYAMAQYYGRPALYFNPVLDSCPTFNPLYGKEEDVIENVVTAFKMLSPSDKVYFQDMNEQLLRNALKVLKRSKGNEATLVDLSLLIGNKKMGQEMVTRFITQVGNKKMTESMRVENEDICTYFQLDYFGDKSKTYENTSGIRSQVSKLVSNKFLRRVLNPVGKSDIDFDKHLEEGTVLCISTAQGKLRELSKYLGYFVILNFQASVFRRPGTENTRRHHFLYIDEFQTYSNPGFADMLTQGRSYRVASHLATQNRALIGMGSGRAGDDFIELVSTNARNLIIYPGGNTKDAKYYSDQFGTEISKELKTSISRKKFNPLSKDGGGSPTESERFEDIEKARFSSTDIMMLKFGEITYSIIQNSSVTPAGVGKISWIPKELNDILDNMVIENNMLMMLNLNPNRLRDLTQHGIFRKGVNLKQVMRDYDEKIYQLEHEDFNDLPKEHRPKPEGSRPKVEFDSVKTKATSTIDDIAIEDFDDKSGAPPTPLSDDDFEDDEL